MCPGVGKYQPATRKGKGEVAALYPHHWVTSALLEEWSMGSSVYRNQEGKIFKALRTSYFKQGVPRIQAGDPQEADQEREEKAKKRET